MGGRERRKKMLGEKMEEYILEQLKGKDVVIKELQERVKQLEYDNKCAYERENEIKDALTAVGRELVFVILRNGDEYIKIRNDDWNSLRYERREVLTLRPYIKNVRDERKKEQEEEEEQ